MDAAGEFMVVSTEARTYSVKCTVSYVSSSVK